MKAPLLVLGASGVIGRGVVEAALAASLPVIAVARDARKLQRLQARHTGADLRVMTGTLAGDAGAAQLVEKLRALGRPLAGVVVAVCGGGGRGRLLDRPVAALRRALDQDVLPHLAAARHLLPLLAEGRRGARYVLVGGPGSESPWAGYGPRSVAAAALRMLACALHEEMGGSGVRVQLLVVDTPVCTEENRAHACPRWPTALAIGRRALALIERADDSEPTRAIVRFVPHARDESLQTVTPPASEAGGDNSAQSATAHEPDHTFDGSARRCLDDARVLLRTLISNNGNEVSR